MFVDMDLHRIFPRCNEPGDVTQGAYRRLNRYIANDVDAAASEAFGVTPEGFPNVVRSPEADPYPTWEDMKHAARVARGGGAPFRVSNVNHNHPCWSMSQNYAFRVHHDAVHVLGGHAAFTVLGEARVTRYTLERLGVDVGGPITELWPLALVAEIIGQATYHAEHGSFPLAAARQAVPNLARPATRRALRAQVAMLGV